MSEQIDRLVMVDDWLDSRTNPTDPNYEGICYAKWVIAYFRLPAGKQFEQRKFMGGHHLFCTYNGRRYRCTGASRMGDVWLVEDFRRDAGYDIRVYVIQCSGWSDGPDEPPIERTKIDAGRVAARSDIHRRRAGDQR